MTFFSFLSHWLVKRILASNSKKEGQRTLSVNLRRAMDRVESLSIDGLTLGVFKWIKERIDNFDDLSEKIFDSDLELNNRNDAWINYKMWENTHLD